MKRTKLGTDAGYKWEAVQKVAFDELGIRSLARQGSDSLDIHELGVWEIEKALRAAYEAGRNAPQ